MFTQCRGCGEIFPVSVDDLITASAMVRCSSCGAVFNSLDTLSEYKPNENADLILHDIDNPPPLLNHEFKESVVERIPNKIRRQTEELDDGAIFNVKPDFVADTVTKRSPVLSLFWYGATLGLLVVLLWQVTASLKDGSLQLPQNKLTENICDYVECFKGAKESNLNQIALVSRSIRQHPGRDNALIITAGIINSDKQTQLFPALQVKMSNLNGEIVAMRRFLPFEYIDSETISTGMLSNTLIPISIELQSPGKNAVTFEVGFSPTFGADIYGLN